MRLKDPEQCPSCNARRFRVVSSRRRAGYRRKVLRCKECGAKWPAFFTVIDPRRAWEAMSDAERSIYSAKRTA
jgi:predicted Zn finger-like uncharacterized protein